MKIIAFIMAFLVLSLSIMPCGDEAAPFYEHHTNSELTQTNQHSHTPLHDACTPFCHCTCCAGFSVNHFITSTGFIPYFGNSLNSLYCPAKAIEISLPIWQPPQLV